MNEKLKYSPLIEALCEFRFVPSPAWDWTIPGRLYDAIGREFPERAQVNAVKVPVLLDSGNPVAPPFLRAPERVQLKRADGSAMVQVGPHLLVVNHLRPYAGWQGFRPIILDAYTQHEKITGLAKLARIGLRYINQIPLPKHDCRLEEVTTLIHRFHGTLERPVLGMYHRYELVQEKPEAVLILQLGIQREDQGNLLMLDLDIGSASNKQFAGPETVMAWLDEAHDRIDNAFLDAITPALLEKWKRGEPC